MIRGLLLLVAVAGASAQTHRLEITLEKQEKGQWRKVDPGLVLEQGDKVRFRASANFAGYLYVMNRATSGDYSLLFPREDTGRANRIEQGREYLVPATEGHFSIAGPPGHEIVYWLVSPVEFQPGVRPVPGTAGRPPAKLIPRCDDTILRARGDCVDTSAGPRPLRENERLPENLAALREAASRELVFVRRDKAAVVSAPHSLEGPVIFEFRVAHK